jgi:Transposase
MIQEHLENVLTYFDHRITNATSEGLNSKIQTVKKTRMDTATASISKRPFSSIAEAWRCTPCVPRRNADYFQEFWLI